MRDAYLAFCDDFLDVSYSQRFQDLFCLWIAGLKHDGYFVEFGALTGINVSNSYLLEKLGWTGIVAEPHPACHDHLRANRSAIVVTDCVWTTTGEVLQFNAVKGKPALSTISGLEHDDIQNAAGARDNFVVVEVPTISLTDMLDRAGAPKFIDCLSIDTEGSELAILSAFDFDAYRFGCIVVEHGFSSKRELIHEVLSNQGYARMWPELSGHDDFYVHAACLPTEPPNPADHAALARVCASHEGVHKPEQRWLALANMADAVGDIGMRIRALEATAALVPGRAGLFGELGQAYAEAGQLLKAIRAFDRALAINPNLAPAARKRRALLALAQ